MSIIYEALLKTQKKRSNPYNDFSQTQFTISHTTIALLLVIFFLLIFISYEMYEKFSKLAIEHVALIPKTITEVTKPAIPKPRTMLLKGVYISSNERLALINNQTVHVGDLIEGMKVINISFNKVTLQGEKNILVLTE